MKKPKASQIYGVLVLAVSAYWVWGLAISPLIRWFGKRENAASDASLESHWSIDWFVTLGHLGILTIVGVLIYCGVGLVRNRSLPPWRGAEDFPEEERWRGQIVVDSVVTYVRYSLGMFAAVGVLSIGVKIEARWPGALFDEIVATLPILIATVMILPVFVFAVRLILRSRGYQGVELRYVIGKPLIAFVAFQIWMVMSDLFRLWVPRGNIDVPGMNLLLGLSTLFGSILAAWLFYKIVVHLLRYEQIDLDLRRAGLRPIGESKKER